MMDERVMALLAEIRDDLHALRRDVDALHARPPESGDVALAGLLAAVRAAVADRVFSAGDLLIHAQLPPAIELHAAILTVVGVASARRIGKCFARIEGRNLGGLAVERVASDSTGILWSVHRV